ncbi:chloride channel protein [Levilactobacillus bambusae]|uniref:Chloride channel protein n=1 Tax=Levilactobacillus bambusae TaxID=2024736 RepID=A0A2V1N2B6_9LACO|nr:chloride channel protein [Levilactobacillus bambusae]PWG00445.1 chloride channel protein [Levilactobacillus bambusae]
MSMLNRRSNLTLILSTVVLGVFVGAGALVLGSFLDLIEQLFLNFEESAFRPAPSMISPVHRLLSLVVGGLIAAVLWWWISARLKPSGSVNSAVAGKRMPVGSTLVDVITQIFYVGTGGPVGREVAPRQLGALIAQSWVDLLNRVRSIKITEDDRKLLIASAAGAGFAGIYLAPITGMMFCVEILLKKATKRTVAVSLTMSIIAMLVGSILRGFNPYYLVGSGKFSVDSLLLVLVIAPVCGIVGALFRRSFQWAGRHKAQKATILWQLPLISLVTGLIAMSFPEVMGNGRSLAEAAIHMHLSTTATALLIGALAKGTVTVLTLKSGAAGGTLTPSISIGAVIGGVIGFVASLFFPGIQIWQYAVIGASALLATSQQAPLMALFMLFEICHLNYSALLPLGLGVCLALAFGNLVIKIWPVKV